MFIYSILPWSADTLLLATEGNDLQWYLPRENRFEQIHTNKAQLAAEGLAIDANVTALHRVNDTLLWAGTYQGAYLINPLRGTVYNVVTGSGSRLLQSSKVYDILSIQENGRSEERRVGKELVRK